MTAIRRLVAILALCGLLPALAKATVPSFDPEGPSPAYTEAANGTTTDIPAIEARYLDGAEIELDGRLDEAAWNDAQTGWGFRQADPNRYSPASVPTTFKILYDDDAIYIGVACWENDMADVASQTANRS